MSGRTVPRAKPDLLMATLQEVRDLLIERGLGTQDAMIIHVASLGAVSADAAEPADSAQVAWRKVERSLRGLFVDSFDDQRRKKETLQ